MSRNFAIALLSGAILICSSIAVSAQEYVTTPVTISKEKVRSGGKVYYSHVVQEKQTLYSISKAYGVTVEEIYEANTSLNLETEGLKANQIIRIPISDQAGKHQEEPDQADVVVSSESPAAEAVQPTAEPQPEDYIIHTVKWFEDLKSISAKYGIPTETIMAYNGLTTTKLSRRQKIKIPNNPASLAEEIEEDTPVQPEDNVVEDVAEEENEGIEDLIGGIFGRRNVTASLILPLNASASPSDNQYDFYSGALLAVRDLEREGIKVNLHVYDCAGGSLGVTSDELSGSDIIIGPVSSDDISKALNVCPQDKYIISPLEPKVLSMTAEIPNLIQAPSSAEMQCREVVNWLLEELTPGDKVILFTEKGATPTANVTSLISALDSSRVTYTTIDYGILQGRNIISTLERSAAPEGSTSRILVASESEAFVNDVVRNVNTLVYRKHDAVLYCTSKVRSFDTIEVDHFHNSHMRTCASYFIDYEDKRVKQFLLSYRALFGGEPGPFAFQGYDTTYQFIKARSLYGRRWTDKVDGERLRGLQSDYLLERTESGSLVNKAVRRILYDDNYVVRLYK